MGIRMLADHFSEKDIENYVEEDYDAEELEEMKERAMPFLGGERDQAITLTNASAQANASNLKQSDNADEEEDDIVSKLSPLTDNQFSFSAAGHAL